jgi:hypothetical protein
MNSVRLNGTDTEIVRSTVTHIVEQAAVATKAAPARLKTNIVTSVALSALSTLHQDGQMRALRKLRDMLDQMIASPGARPDFPRNVEHGGRTDGPGKTGSVN